MLYMQGPPPQSVKVTFETMPTPPPSKPFPVFSVNSTCAKCGYGQPLAKWQATSGLLLRTCRRCEFSWEELPLDRV